MKFLRKKRGLAAFGAVAAVTCLMLFVVLPAFGSSPVFAPNPSVPGGITPQVVSIGGNGDCPNIFPNIWKTGAKEYDNVNPPTSGMVTQASGNNDNVSFTLTGSGGNNLQTMTVTASPNAVILGIGIKGGTQTTAYDYTGLDYPLEYGTTGKPPAPAGSITSDGNLHGPVSKYTPAGQPSQYYAISHMTVCYKLAPAIIKGTVYEDLNKDGSYQDPSSPTPDNPLGTKHTWTVDLYAGSSTTPTAQTVSTANGSFSFTVPAGTTYRVCEVPNNADLSGGTDTWIQSQPYSPPPAASCSGAGEANNGYAETPTPGQVITDNLGNVAGYKCSGSVIGPGGYQVGTCKGNKTYAFSTGNLPDGAPYATYGLGVPSPDQVATIEHLNVADTFTNSQPDYKSVLYTNHSTFPLPQDLTTLNWQQMPYCTFDVRPNPSSSPFGLPSPLPPAATVIPGYDQSNPDSPLACVISVTTSAPAAPGGTGVGTLDAWVYALDDAGRGFN